MIQGKIFTTEQVSSNQTVLFLDADQFEAGTAGASRFTQEALHE